MGLTETFFGSSDPRDGGTVSSTDSSGLFAGSATGERVNDASTLGIAAAYAAINVLATAIASLPVRIFELRATGERVEVFDHPLHQLLTVAPNPYMTPVGYFEMTMLHSLLRGVGYSQIIRNGAGDVVSIMPLHPDSVQVEMVNDRLVYTVTESNGNGGQGKQTKLSSREIAHFRGLYSDILTPITPIQYARNTLGLGIALERHESGNFGPYAVRPGGVLETDQPMEDKAANRVLSLFNFKYAGPGSVGKTIILDKGLKFKPITMTHQDAQFLELRKFGVTEICRFFNVPPSFVHHYEDANFNNAGEQALFFLKFSMRPHVERLESEMRRSFFGPRERQTMIVEFDTSALLRGDEKSRAEYLKTMVSYGGYSIDDIRDRLGEPRFNIDGVTNVPLMQLNMAPIEVAIEAVRKKTGGGTSDSGGSNNDAP